MTTAGDAIRTTHVGSLPRPADLLEMLVERDEGRPVDMAQFDGRVREAIGECVQMQRRIGLDVINDGELGKPDYSTYIKHRLTGFEGEPMPMPVNRDAAEFPDFQMARNSRIGELVRPSCNGPIAWKDFESTRRDIENLKAAVENTDTVFMTSVSPGQVARFQGNRYYKSEEDYLWALAGVLKDEYKAIADAGFILQIDCPDLASGWNGQFGDLTLAEFRKIVDLHIDILNAATEGISPDAMRIHLCWGNYEGPHSHDIPLAEIIGSVFNARPAAISFEGANPRHGHEWRVFEEVKLPEGKSLVPGVIDSTTNFVEHPELVAQRIMAYARLVGPANVVAGVDCGFATFAGRATVAPSIVWAKLRALVDGARMASERLGLI